MRYIKILLMLNMTLLVTGCSFIVSRVVPVNDIQAPSGSYKVGTQLFYWTDSDRDEWFSEIDGDKRELVVQVWYPSNNTSDETDPWLDNISIREEAIMDNFKVPKFIAKSIDRVDTDTFVESSPVTNKIFPIIIFSHGFEGFRSQNTTQIQELVSNGYIVFALDHTYDATLTVMPDGRAIPRAKRYCYDCPPDEFYDVFIPQINTRISDIKFLINQIEKIKSGDIESNFSKSIDTDNIGIFGHSFGGGTSLATSILDSRIKSCLSLDGWYAPVHPEVYNQGLSIPFLHLGQVEWSTPKNYEILNLILESKVNEGYKLSLEGAHHYDFTDAPHLSKLSSSFKLSSDLDSDEILLVTNTAVLGFFDEHLKLKDTGWLEKLKKNINTTVEEFKNNEE